MSTFSEVDTLGKRRSYTDDFRRLVVEETLSGVDSVSVVARRHDINTNLVFKWRQKHLLRMRAASEATAALVPIHLQAPEKPNEETPIDAEGVIEIALSGGHRLCVRGAVDAAALRLVLEALQ